MDCKFQKDLDYYLNSSISKTSEEPSFPALDDFVALYCQLDKTGPSLSSSLDSDSKLSYHYNTSEDEVSEIKSFEANYFTLNDSQDKEETHETSDSNYSNSHSNSECERNACDIEVFDPNSSDRHDPLGFKVK